MRRLIVLVIVATCILAADVRATSLWTEESHPLYTNRKASRVGDLITVLIVESTQGYNRATSNSKREESQGLGGQGTGPLDFIPLFGWSFDKDSEFKGSSNNRVEGGLNARISAQVIDILPNGHLVISGTRSLKVNGEDETITVLGEVRPEDVRANNTVMSTNIANAEIEYRGDGPATDAVKRGILHRLFNWLF